MLYCLQVNCLKRNKQWRLSLKSLIWIYNRHIYQQYNLIISFGYGSPVENSRRSHFRMGSNSRRKKEIPIPSEENTSEYRTVFQKDQRKDHSIQWALCTAIYMFARRNKRSQGKRNVHFSIPKPHNYLVSSLFPREYNNSIYRPWPVGAWVYQITNCLFPVGVGLGLSDPSLCWPTNKTSCP